MLCFVLINSVILNFLCAWILFHASCCHWCSHLCCSFIFNQEPDMRPNFAELLRQLSELNREGDYPHIEWLWFTPLLPFTLGDEVLGMSSTQKSPSHQNAALTSLAPLPPPAPPQPPPPLQPTIPFHPSLPPPPTPLSPPRGVCLVLWTLSASLVPSAWRSYLPWALQWSPFWSGSGELPVPSVSYGKDLFPPLWVVCPDRLAWLAPLFRFCWFCFYLPCFHEEFCALLWRNFLCAWSLGRKKTKSTPDILPPLLMCTKKKRKKKELMHRCCYW